MAAAPVDQYGFSAVQNRNGILTGLFYTGEIYIICFCPFNQLFYLYMSGEKDEKGNLFFFCMAMTLSTIAAVGHLSFVCWFYAGAGFQS